MTALERLTAAAGFDLTRDGKLFVVHAPQMDDLPPRGKSSAGALAHTVAALRDDPRWPELRDATAYDPGLQRLVSGKTVEFVVKIPSGLSGWEEGELIRLAVTELPG